MQFTKTVTAILFSQFLDQGLIDLDDSLATVFPDYPTRTFKSSAAAHNAHSWSRPYKRTFQER